MIDADMSGDEQARTDQGRTLCVRMTATSVDGAATRRETVIVVGVLEIATKELMFAMMIIDVLVLTMIIRDRIVVSKEITTQ